MSEAAIQKINGSVSFTGQLQAPAGLHCLTSGCSIFSEISSQVVNGLFTVTGVGFIPWRVRDAYRISAIWRLQHIDRKLRKKQGLPAYSDKNEAPDPEKDEEFVQVSLVVLGRSQSWACTADPLQYATSTLVLQVMTDHQQERLKYQQRAFQKSQTWYRPHATETHRAFSLNWALAICLVGILTD